MGENEIKEYYFLGEKVSDYGCKHQRVDYATLSRAINTLQFDNNVIADYPENWEFDDALYQEDEEGNYPDVMQWLLTDEYGANILRKANEIVGYCQTLDVYVWGITHYGTSWDYVLTNIKIYDNGGINYGLN